jgi:hypothetical protein
LREQEKLLKEEEIKQKEILRLETKKKRDELLE